MIVYENHVGYDKINSLIEKLYEYQWEGNPRTLHIENDENLPAEMKFLPNLVNFKVSYFDFLYMEHGEVIEEKMKVKGSSKSNSFAILFLDYGLLINRYSYAKGDLIVMTNKFMETTGVKITGEGVAVRLVKN